MGKKYEKSNANYGRGKNNPRATSDSDAVASSKDSGRNYSGKGGRGSADKYNRKSSGVLVPDHNTPSWYNRFSALVRDSATLPFSNPLGELLDSRSFGYSSWLKENATLPDSPKEAIPGIMILECIDAPGISRDGASPINIAAKAMYNFVRHANSGSSTYDSSDLMQYVYAADAAYSLWAHLVRAYATLTTFSYSNRYLGEALFYAQGFDWDHFKDRMADFRAVINQFAIRLASICVPADIAMVSRHLWMYGNIFTDSDNTKGQIYMYRPAYVWAYAEVKDERGGLLEPHYTNCDTIEEVSDLIDKVISPLITSESLMNMAGDLRKAYGDSNLMKIASIPDVVSIQLTYDTRAQMELQNVTIVPLDEVDELEILADANTNTIIFDPTCTAGTDTPWQRMHRKLLNINEAAPTPDDVMKATRLMAFSAQDADNQYLKVDSCGTEIVFDMKVAYYGYDYSLNTRSMNVESYRGSGVDAHSSMWLTMLANFDYHPILYLTAHDSEMDKNLGLSIYGDLSNYTTLDDSTLRRMHEAALFSELWSPAMGTFMKD